MTEDRPKAQLMGTSDRPSAVLTPDDIETLRHLARRAASENTLRSLASDLTYLEAWHRAAYDGTSLPWPCPESVALRFIAHHLFIAEERTRDERHGMPASVESSLRAEGVLRGALPHAPSTVARRLSSWRTLHGARGYDDALSSRTLRMTLRAASKAQDRVPQRKSAKPVTRDVLDLLLPADLPHGDMALRDLRDGALLMVAFASGGRRRSELGELLIERIERSTRTQPDGGQVASARIAVGRTKTTEAIDGAFVVVAGRALVWLEAWLAALARSDRTVAEKGPIFRGIDRWGKVSTKGLSGDAVGDVLKRRAEEAGLASAEYSPHGLRSGYLTEASRRGVPIEVAMRHSLHRTVQAAQRYYDEQEREAGLAAQLAD